MKPSEVLTKAIADGHYTGERGPHMFMCAAVKGMHSAGLISEDAYNATLHTIEVAIHPHHSLRMKLGQAMSMDYKKVSTKYLLQYWEGLIEDLKTQDK